jgi:hypothetical protein
MRICAAWCLTHAPLTRTTRERHTSYERAVQFDPGFALAWARLSRATGTYFIRATKPQARRDVARRALENAQELSPNLPETQLALGYYQYWYR